MKGEFEEQIEMAKSMLDKLMSPEITLQDSLKYYKDAQKALAKAQKMIEEAQKEVVSLQSESQE